MSPEPLHKAQDPAGESAATDVLGLLSRRIAGPGLLVVSGVSGAGKSSLLHAGVLPRFRGAGLESAPVPQYLPWPGLRVAGEQHGHSMSVIVAARKLCWLSSLTWWF